MSQNDETSLIVIDPVQTSALPTINPSSGLLPLIEALNPLGALGKAIVEIMAYRIEAKRLHQEEIRVKEQSKVAQQYINAQLNVKLRDLEFRREAMLAGINYAEKVLYERRATRNTLISAHSRAIQELTRLTSRTPFPPTTAFQVYRDVIADISNQLVRLEELGVQQSSLLSNDLSRLVSDVRRDLLPPPRR